MRQKVFFIILVIITISQLFIFIWGNNFIKFDLETGNAHDVAATIHLILIRNSINFFLLIIQVVILIVAIINSKSNHKAEYIICGVLFAPIVSIIFLINNRKIFYNTNKKTADNFG